MDKARIVGLSDRLDFKATFCFEKCKQSPNVQVGDTIHGGITPDKIDTFFEEVVKPAAEQAPVKEGLEV